MRYNTFKFAYSKKEFTVADEYVLINLITRQSPISIIRILDTVVYTCSIFNSAYSSLLLGHRVGLRIAVGKISLIHCNHDSGFLCNFDPFGNYHL